MIPIRKLLKPDLSLPCLLVLLLLSSGCQTGSGIDTGTFQFALLGDNPYAPESFPKYERMIDAVNETPDIDWVIHLGDMKDGGTPCTDGAFAAIKTLNDRFRMPFVLTPGDNDWFDCKRESAGGFDRRERLAKIRELFFAEQLTLPVNRQPATGSFSDYIENVYWQKQGVLFATLHVVGVNGIEGGMDIHAENVAAAVAWLETVFSVARQDDVNAVFLAMQADPYPFSGERGWLQSLCPGGCPDVRPGYEALHAALLEHTRQFRKPVMLAVGDTHVFRVDKPLYDGDALVEHFTRVEPFGENEVHWVRVVVDPSTPQVFTIHQELVPDNLR